MKKNFQGVWTAIVTPFKQDQSIDWEALEKLVEFQIQNGVKGITACGTTGESPTLTDKEHNEVIKNIIKWVNKRCLVMAGTGSNSTAETVKSTKHAEQMGVDCCLVVNPYYNKPTQEGLYQHFKATADSVKIPIVIYNIKGRSAVNLETHILMRLINDCSNIVAVKEASGDLEQIKNVINQSPDSFAVLSGDDGLVLNLIKAGGDGVISVASNVVPNKMVSLVDYALKGDFEKAQKINDELAEFFNVEFIETNPLPIKAVLAMQGKIEEVYRLPMCKMSEENRKKLKSVFDKINK